MTIYAIAIATNLDKANNLHFAIEQLGQLGHCEFSAIYEIPCRDHIGEDYWNCASLITTDRKIEEILRDLKQLEELSGRKRPSHSISLDVDLIAWGKHLNNMQFNPKKLPLENDVIIPLAELWSHSSLVNIAHNYRLINQP